MCFAHSADTALDLLDIYDTYCHLFFLGLHLVAFRRVLFVCVSCVFADMERFAQELFALEKLCRVPCNYFIPSSFTSEQRVGGVLVY